MLVIVKREFRSLMLSVRGIVFLGVFLASAGILTALYNISSALGSFEIALSYLVPVLVLTLPLISADAFAIERDKRTDRLLRMLPLRTRDIVLGKYLARLCVIALAMAILCLYPLILDLYGTVSYATAYLTLLALFLIAAILVALGMLISALAPSHRYALVWAYIVFAVWYAASILVSFLPYAPLASLLTDLSPFRAFDEFVFGVLDLRILLQFGLWMALFLLLTAIGYAKANGLPLCSAPRGSLLRRMSAAVLSLCLVGCTILGFVGALLLPSRTFRVDLTREKVYTLSQQTKQFLSKLDRDVTIYVLDANRADRRFEMFLDTMASYSKHLTVTEIDTAKKPEFLTEHGLGGTTVSPYGLVIAGEEREQYVAYENLFSFSNATLGVTDMSYSTYQYYLYTFQSSEQYASYLSALLTDTVQYFEGETLLSLLVEYAAAVQMPTVYLLEGLGTATSESVAAYVMAYYGVEYRSLIFDQTPSVPSDAASIILAKPTRDLGAAEADALRTYLGSGGQLTVLTDESNLEMPNLCGLLAEYGMTATKGALTETVKPTAEGGEATETTTLKLTPNLQHDLFASYADNKDFSVTVTNANAIRYPANPAGSLIVTPLLTTAAECYVSGNSDAKASYAAAVAAETADGARVAWFTGVDSFIGNMEQTPTTEAIQNALCVLMSTEWSSKRYTSSLGEVEPKPYSSEWLTISSAAATAWNVILILIVPCAAISYGIVTRYGRRKAK